MTSSDAYTVAGREDALDFMADYPDYGEQRWYTTAVAAEAVSFSWRRMLPGTGGRGSYGHRHPGQEEVYFVISGVITFKIGDDVFEAGPQTSVRVGGDAFRSIHNDTGEQAQVLIVSPRLEEPLRSFKMTSGADLQALIDRYDAAWNAQDLDVIASMHDDAIVFHNYTAGERVEGAAAVRAHIGKIFARWPTLRFERRSLALRRGFRRQRVDGACRASRRRPPARMGRHRRVPADRGGAARAQGRLFELGHAARARRVRWPVWEAGAHQPVVSICRARDRQRVRSALRRERIPEDRHDLLGIACHGQRGTVDLLEGVIVLGRVQRDQRLAQRRGVAGVERGVPLSVLLAEAHDNNVGSLDQRAGADRVDSGPDVVVPVGTPLLAENRRARRVRSGMVGHRAGESKVKTGRRRAARDALTPVRVDLAREVDLPVHRQIVGLTTALGELPVSRRAMRAPHVAKSGAQATDNRAIARCGTTTISVSSRYADQSAHRLWLQSPVGVSSHPETAMAPLASRRLWRPGRASLNVCERADDRSRTSRKAAVPTWTAWKSRFGRRRKDPASTKAHISTVVEI